MVQTPGEAVEVQLLLPPGLGQGELHGMVRAVGREREQTLLQGGSVGVEIDIVGAEAVARRKGCAHHAVGVHRGAAEVYRRQRPRGQPQRRVVHLHTRGADGHALAVEPDKEVVHPHAALRGQRPQAQVHRRAHAARQPGRGAEAGAAFLLPRRARIAALALLAPHHHLASP